MDPHASHRLLQYVCVNMYTYLLAFEKCFFFLFFLAEMKQTHNHKLSHRKLFHASFELLMFCVFTLFGFTLPCCLDDSLTKIFCNLLKDLIHLSLIVDVLVIQCIKPRVMQFYSILEF